MVKKTSLKIDDLVVVMQQCGLTIEKNKDIRLAEFLKVKSWGEVFNRNQMNRKKGYAELLVDEMRKRDER